METLQEYLVYTKGWEYIITIIFVLAFMGFWRLLSGSSDHEGSEGSRKGARKA